jgi:hypothetical protein
MDQYVGSFKLYLNNGITIKVWDLGNKNLEAEKKYPSVWHEIQAGLG